jgi:hypothetical protein
MKIPKTFELQLWPCFTLVMWCCFSQDYQDEPHSDFHDCEGRESGELYYHELVVIIAEIPASTS